MEKVKSIIKNRPKFSVPILAFFVFIFVATGVYMVYNMFAATIDNPVADKYVYNSKTIERVWGPNRYVTAEAISKSSYTLSELPNTVILVNGTNWPDATAASGLAGAYNAPILLTQATGLSAEASREIQRIKPTKVFIIGGSESISPVVESVVRNNLASTATVTRIAGGDRYETAANIASEMKSKLGTIPDGKAFIVSGANFPDSLTVGSVAAYKKYPVLFSDTTLNVSTANAIRNLGITKTVVVGGEASVSAAVYGAVPSPVRVAGADRYKTSIAFAKWSVANAGLSPYNVGVVSGLDFPDALSAANFMATRPNPGILVLSPKDGNADVNTYLDSIKSNMNSIFVFGGSSSISTTYFATLGKKVGITLNADYVRAQSLLDGYILKYPMLAGSTVEIGDARGYQAISYYQSGRVVISPTHSASIDRIMAHEIWHIIDWRWDNKIDWYENIPPTNASYFVGR